MKNKPIKTSLRYKMEISFDLTKPFTDDFTKADELRAIIFHQTSFLQDLLHIVSVCEAFAVSSLLIPDNEVNEFEFNVAELLESFKTVTKFSNYLIENVADTVNELHWLATGGQNDK